ncbi:hypothetical protein V500_07593 [Pseudogymnoascus sp. VKM F-4518 (FW-2643)]|nr:hypothetical protein V500_07593 [Pseudogymnoascus sp. VKM F-4518 (FW-2643)]
MAIYSASSLRGRSPTPKDPLSALTQALAGAQGAQLLELLAARLKANKLTDQAEAKPHDFDLSRGAREVMYVTFRMGPRQELVFKIVPGTIMRRALDLCLDTWRGPEGDRYMASELFFYLPCNTKIDYDDFMTAEELEIENHDLIDVYSESYGG